MPGMYDADRARPMPDITRQLFNLDSEKVPILDMIPEGDPMKGMISDWETEQTERRARKGRKDGEAVVDFDFVPQAKLIAYAGHLLEPWKVTKVTGLFETAGVKDQKAHQSQKALSQLFLAMERMLASDGEMQAGSSIAEYEFRGIFKWLQSAAQAVQPVPDDYRITAAQELTDPLDQLTESAFEDALAAAWTQTNGAMLSLDGFVGNKLKSVMNKWAQLVTVTSTQQATLSRNINVADKKHIVPVDEFVFDVATVRNHLSANLLVDTAGALTDYSSRSGAFLNLEAWKVCYGQKPTRFELPQDGSGWSGYADTVMLPKCFNPKGQVVVKTNLDT